MPRLLSVLLLLAVPAATSPAAQPVPADTLTAPQPQYGYEFGQQIAAAEADGLRFLLVLEPYRPPEGAAYVFARDTAANAWTVEATLSSVAPSGGLGQTEPALCVDGPRPLVVLSDAGQVALWRRGVGGAPWSVEAMLQHAEPCCGNPFFGSGLAAAFLPSGEEVVLVGAQYGGTPGQGIGPGVAYSFARDPDSGAWARETRIFAPDSAHGDEFGAAVAVLPLPGGHPGDALTLIGAPWQDDGGDPNLNTGAAYVFRRDGASGAWTFEHKLVGDDLLPFGHDHFGNAVALAPLPGGVPSEVLALVGAYQHGHKEGEAFYEGAAYVFRRHSDGQGGFAWAQEAELLGSRPHLDLHAGYSVALHINASTGAVRALVGSAPEDPFEDHPGAAYLFTRDPATGAWAERARLATERMGGPADRFGWSVAFAGDEVLVGAPWSWDGGVPGTGAVFAYSAQAVPNEGPTPVPEEASLAVFPNPARGSAQAVLTLPAAGVVRVAVYDALGREAALLHEGALAGGTHAFRLDGSALPPGVYFVRARGEGASASRPLTVLR